MRTQTLIATRRCNQRCRFCDRVDPHATQATDPPLSELARALEVGAADALGRVVISGGEPTLRGDLVALVALARSRGASDVALDTNATRIGAELAVALRQAGLAEVTVSFLGASHETCTSVAGPTADPRLVLRGMKACLDAGLVVRVRLPIATGLPPAAARIEGLSRALPGLGPFVLAPIGQGESTLAPLSPLAELGAELDEAVRAADRLGVSLELSPEHTLAPCGPELPPRARRLFAGVLRAHEGEACRAHEACGACALGTRCTLGPGALARALGATPPRPVADARPFLRPGKSAGARLHVLSDRDVEQFFHVDYEYDVDHERPTSRIGIIYRCNQVCTFCELADMDVDLPAARVRAALDAAFARGSRRVILTGGEPTLSPDLLGHLAHARQLGFHTIELQTNAILFDRPGFAQAARDAGLTHAQISLHGADAETSDRLTAAAGTHARTLRGVGALLEAGVTCLLNHLIFKDNCAELESFVRFVHARWGSRRSQLVVQFHSPRNEFADRAEALRHVPRYSEYVEPLKRAIDLARELGIATRDVQDPTGIPALCVLSADARYLGRIAEQAEAPRLHAWEKSWLVRVPACSRCELAGACMGVPKTYVELHGDSEFRPLSRAELSP